MSANGVICYPSSWFIPRGRLLTTFLHCLHMQANLNSIFNCLALYTNKWNSLNSWIWKWIDLPRNIVHRFPIQMQVSSLHIRTRFCYSGIEENDSHWKLSLHTTTTRNWKKKNTLCVWIYLICKLYGTWNCSNRLTLQQQRKTTVVIILEFVFHVSVRWRGKTFLFSSS